MLVPAQEQITRFCPICTTPTADLGPILHPMPAVVAGVPIDLKGVQFRLRGCRACGFQFKDPHPSEKKLLECYGAAQPSVWGKEVEPAERQFDVIAAAVRRHARGHRLLDVGCFNGAFLQYMDSDWDRYGIEPGSAAASMARSRGVNVLGPTTESLKGVVPFDAITAMDVVEHIVDPLPFFRDLRRSLRAGGVCAVVTGDTSSLPWRLHGSRYWYCSLVEHVSFYCLEAIRHAATQSQMQVIEYQRLSHVRAGAIARARGWIKGLGYYMGLGVNAVGLQFLSKTFADRRGPTWVTARDHMLVVLRAIN